MIKIESVAEFAARGMRERAARIAVGWGDHEYRWVYHAENLTLELVHDGRWCYEVDLERCTTSAEMLDWIFQVQGKGWPGASESLLMALFDLLHPQGNLCSWGVERGPISVRKVIERETGPNGAINHDKKGKT